MKLNIEDRYKSGIYCIENTINNKKYIGHSKNIYQRISAHISYIKYNYKDVNRFLKNSVNKYGIENFKYYVLEYINSYDEQLLKKLELFYINKYNTTNTNFGYNLRLDNEDESNIVSESTKKLNAIALQKRYNNFTKDDLNNLYLKIAKSSNKYNYLKCDTNKKILKEYSCRKEIQLDNPEFNLNSINKCCSGYINTYKGYIWIYKNKNNGHIYYDKLKDIKFLQHKNRKDETTIHGY